MSLTTLNSGVGSAKLPAIVQSRRTFFATSARSAAISRARLVLKPTCTMTTLPSGCVESVRISAIHRRAEAFEYRPQVLAIVFGDAVLHHADGNIGTQKHLIEQRYK